MAMMYYTLKEIETISWNLSEKSVSQETLDLINSLADQVASPTYDKTPVFNNVSSTKPFIKKKKKSTDVINDEDWEAIRKRIILSGAQIGYFPQTTPTPDNWLLTNGVWNDSGEWQDDDVWQDS